MIIWGRVWMTRDGSKNWARLGPRWHTHSTISWRNPNFILEETLISLKRSLWLRIAKSYICNHCQSLTNIQRFHQYVLSGAKKLLSICSVFLYLCLLNVKWLLTFSSPPLCIVGDNEVKRHMVSIQQCTSMNTNIQMI